MLYKIFQTNPLDGKRMPWGHHDCEPNQVTAFIDTLPSTGKPYYVMPGKSARLVVHLRTIHRRFPFSVGVATGIVLAIAAVIAYLRFII